MQFTTSSLISLARTKLLELGTEILSDSTMLTYAQLAYQDICLRIFPNSQIVSATLAVTNGVAPLPDDFGTLYTDANNSKYNIFPELSISDFARNIANAIAVEDGELKVSPSTTTSVTIYYWPSFTALSDTSNPAIHTYFQELVIYGIMFRALEDLQDPDQSTYYEGKYEARLAQKNNVISEWEEAAQQGGSFFNEQRLI